MATSPQDPPRAPDREPVEGRRAADGDARAPRPIVELRGVFKRYGEGTPVVAEILHGIDLLIEEGEFVALTGPSGSGKSTLLNIVGLLERASAGQVLIGGQDIAALPETRLTELRGRTIGFVFQFHHLLPGFSALENAMMPAVIDAGRSSEAIERDAREMLRRVGLAGAEDKRPSQLSGGMQQRVAIARALAMSPRLLLADEPTGNLDTKSADDIFDLLQAINREHRSACLIVTHDPRLAARCGRRIEIVDGRLTAGAFPARMGRG